jgi:hypothetical protein
VTSVASVKMAPMAASGVSWAAFADERPDLAQAGRDLLYQFGVGLGFLATVRRDGGPRVHPVCPILHDGELFLLVVPSPKRDDLLRDMRFALHSFPTDGDEDAFAITGTVEPVDEALVREAVVARFLEERPTLTIDGDELDAQRLFGCRLQTCLLTRTDGHGDPHPRHQVWRASAV